MKANSEKTKQSKKATRRVLAGVLCGASVLSLVLSLVMPPISQAVANDAQTVAAADEGSLGDGSGADNDADKGAKEQNSDDAEHGEGEGLDAADPSADGAEAKGAAQSSGDEAVDGDGIAPVAEDETKYDIHSGEELVSKLKDRNLRNEKGAATFKLVADIDCNDEVKLEQNNENLIDVVLDLNGHKIKHTSADKPLFDVANGAALTIKDSGRASETVSECHLSADRGQSLNADNYGKKAELTYDTDGIPSKLTYYVTDSSPNGTGTTESLVEHGIDIKGAIVACNGSNSLKLINIYNGGNFNLESGVLTQKKDRSVRNLVYAENRSTVNINGGYVCGGYCPDNAAGAGISVNNSTLSISNGVIAGNRAPSGGGVYANGSAVTVTGGVISGNSTLDGINGFGGGIMAEGGSVTVSGGYITNNCYARFCGNDGWGCHGGAGLAANNGAHVTISGGQITGNYSKEAGGGVYITDVGRNDQSREGMAWLHITGGIIASNVSFRSEGAGIRVGQMVDAMINGNKDSKVYITNNHCMSRFDWGGGGIFVQGNSDEGKEKTAGRLFVYNSYISSNTAGGYGGGVAVCPTGKTLVTNKEGTAIFGNSSAGNDQSFKEYKREDGSGNDGTPHLSAGGAEGTNKNEDIDAYNSDDFRKYGHADFFLASRDHTTPVAVVTGKMLGGGDARYSGSIELEKAINIPANGAVGVKNSIGLTSGVMSGVMAKDEAAIQARNDAQNEATTFITGNYSWDHGGGIMSNGDLYLGEPADAYVYPSLKLKATKALIDSQTNKNKTLTGNEFSFTVYRKDSGNPIASRAFSPDACTEVGTANNDASGNITFDLGEQFAANGTTGTITYYLVENAGNDHNITYDSAVYEIVVTVEDHTTVLMSVPTRDDPTMTKQLTVHYYTIKNVSATKHSGDLTNSLDDLHADGQGYYSIANSDGSKTFTNVYTPYDSTGSWIPKATKVVKGGEMKEFTLEFATNKDFSENVQSESTQASSDKSQTLCFSEIKYELKDLDKLASDSTGRGANKTFTYYVREQQPSALFTNYKYDKSVYQITVKATDDSNGKINISATYKQIQDRDGNEVTNGTNYDLTDASTPTFTNTYSTSLPLSGMSGVTLTYLAGAAVLCAAAAWMHIRRKANAKGGERRE